MKLIKTMVFKHVRWKFFSVKNLFFCLLILAVFNLTIFLILTSGSSTLLGISVKVHSNLRHMPLDHRSTPFRNLVRQYKPIKDKHLTVVEYGGVTRVAKKLQLNHINLTAFPDSLGYNDHTFSNVWSLYPKLSVSKSPDMLGNDSSMEEDNKNNLLDVDIFGNIVEDGRQREWQRQTRCDRCFKHDFKYEIENNDICKLRTNEPDIVLLILILTSHKNRLQRNVLRETWLTISKNNTGQVRYVFLLGEVPDAKLRGSVAKENDQFKDVIKENFIDSYENLTYKAIMGFKWAATKCAAAKFVMKTDDDVFVHVPNVLNLALNYSALLQTHIVGTCYQKSKPIRITKSKWFASNSSYPQNYYPGFCSGTGYVTSMHVVNRIYNISPYVPFFHLEDVYVALCIQRLGYSLKEMPGFNTYRPKLDICSYRANTRLVTVHHMTSYILRRLWNTNCSNRRPLSRMKPRIVVKKKSKYVIHQI